MGLIWASKSTWEFKLALESGWLVDPALRIWEFDEAVSLEGAAKESDEYSVQIVALRARCRCPPQSLSMKIKATTKTPVRITGILRLCEAIVNSAE